MKRTRILTLAAAIAGFAFIVNTHLEAQEARRLEDVRPGKPVYGDGNVEVLPVQGNVYLVAGGASNITVQKEIGRAHV